MNHWPRSQGIYKPTMSTLTYMSVPLVEDESAEEAQVGAGTVHCLYGYTRAWFWSDRDRVMA